MSIHSQQLNINYSSHTSHSQHSGFFSTERTRTFGFTNTANYGRTLPLNSVHSILISTKKTMVEHAPSFEMQVSSPLATELPSSSGVITTPILSSELRASLLHLQQNVSRFTQASTFEAFPSFTKNEQSSSGGRLTVAIVNYHNASSSRPLMTTHLRRIKSVVFSSSTGSPNLELSQTATRSYTNYATASAVTDHLTKEDTITISNSSVSSYAHSFIDHYFSRTFVNNSAVTLNSSFIQAEKNANLVSQTSHKTFLKSSMAGTIHSFENTKSPTYSEQTNGKRYTHFTLISQAIQKSVRTNEALSTESFKLEPSPTRSSRYDLDESFAHTPNPWQDLSVVMSSGKLLGKSSTLKNVTKTDTIHIVPLEPSLTSIANSTQHQSSTKKMFPSDESLLSPSYSRIWGEADKNATVIQTRSIVSLSHPPSGHSDLSSTKLFQSTQRQPSPIVLTLEKYWTETFTRNPSLSMKKVFSYPTTEVPETVGRKSSLHTIKSVQSFRVTSNAKRSNQMSLEIQSTPTKSTISLSDETTAVMDTGVFSTFSHTLDSKHVINSLHTTTPPLINRSVLSSEIELVTGHLVGKSSVAVSKTSSDELLSRSFTTSSSLEFSSGLISNTGISKMTTAVVSPTPAFSTILSTVLHRSLPGISYGFTSRTFTPDTSKKSSIGINSTKLVTISVIPIFTPCYISYDITITQRLILETYSSLSDSSSSVLHNESRVRAPYGAPTQTKFGTSPFKLTLEPMVSTTSLVPNFTIATFSSSENRFQTKPLFTILGQSQTNLTLKPTLFRHSIGISSSVLGTAFLSMSHSNPTYWTLVRTSSTSSAAPHFAVETLSIRENRSQTTLVITRGKRFTSVILKPTPTMAVSHSRSSFRTSPVHARRVTEFPTLSESEKSLMASRRELDSSTSSTFPLVTAEAWSIMKNWSQTELPVTRYQRRVTTSMLAPTPTMTRGMPYPPTINSSTDPSRTAGLYGTSNESMSTKMVSSSVSSISISFLYYNSHQVTTSAAELKDSSLYYVERSISSEGLESSALGGTPVLSSLSLVTTTGPSSKILSKEDTSSRQYVTFRQSSSVGMRSTSSYVNASLTLPYRTEEKSKSVLWSSPKTFVLTKYATATESELVMKTKNIVSSIVNSYQIASRYLGKISNSRSTRKSIVRSVVAETPLISDTFTTNHAKIISDVATPSLSSTSSNLREIITEVPIIKSRVPLPSSFSPTTITLSSSPYRFASHQYSSIKFGISKHSSTAKISSTPSIIHGNKSVNKATQGFSGNHVSFPPATISENQTPLATKELFSSRVIAVTSTRFQGKSLVVETSSLEKINTEGNYTHSERGLPLVTSMSNLQTAITSSHSSVNFTSHISMNYHNSGFASIDVHLSRSKTFTGFGSKMTSVVTSIKRSTSLLPSSAAAQNEHFPVFNVSTSSSSILLVLTNNSNVGVHNSLSETTLSTSTSRARRKRRDVPNFPPSNESSSTSNVSDKVVLPTTSTVEPAKTLLRLSGVVMTNTESRMSSSARKHDFSVKKSMFIMPSSLITGEEKSKTLLKKTPSLGISSLKASDYLSNAPSYTRGENVATPILQSNIFMNDTYVEPSTSDFPSHMNLPLQSFNYSSPGVSLFVTTSLSNTERIFNETTAANKTLSLARLPSEDPNPENYRSLSQRLHQQEIPSTIVRNTISSDRISIRSHTNSLKNASVINQILSLSSIVINFTKTASSAGVASTSLQNYFTRGTLGASSSIWPLASGDFFSKTKKLKDVVIGNGTTFSAHLVMSNSYSNDLSLFVSVTTIVSSPSVSPIIDKQHNVTSGTRGFLISSPSVSNYNLHPIPSKSSPVLQTAHLYSINSYSQTHIATSASGIPTYSDSVQGSLTSLDTGQAITINNKTSFATSSEGLNKTLKTSTFVFFNSEYIIFSPSVSLFPKLQSVVNSFQSTISLMRVSELQSVESLKSVDRTISSKSHLSFPKLSLAKNISHEVSSFAQKATISGVTTINVHSSRSTHFMITQTLPPVKEATDYSTVSRKNTIIAPSPSLSFTSAKNDKVMPTLGLDVSSHIIKEKNQSSELFSLKAKAVTSNSLKHSESKWMWNSSITNSDVQVSSSSFTTATPATTNTTNSISVDTSGPIFNYYVISTSTLGSCIVSYSTLFLPVFTVEASWSTTGPFTRHNSSSKVLKSPSPILFISSSETTSIIIQKKGSSVAANTTDIPIRSMLSTHQFIKTSETSSIRMIEIVSSSVTNRSRISTSSLLAELSKSSVLRASERRSSVVSRMVTSVINYLSNSTRNLSATFPKSYTDQPPTASRLHASSAILKVLPSPTLLYSLLQASLSGEPSLSIQSTSTAMSTSIPGASSAESIAPSLSTSHHPVSPSSSVVTTSFPTSLPEENENSLLLIVLAVPVDVNVTTKGFKEELELKLNNVYQSGRKVEARRRKRSIPLVTSVEVTHLDLHIIAKTSRQTFPGF